jgi:hypothetical protein
LDTNPLDLLAEIPGLEGLLFVALIAATLCSLLGAWLATARRKRRREVFDATLDARFLVPFRVRVLRPGIVAVVAAGFASIALVQCAVHVLDIPIGGVGRTVRMAFQFGPILLLSMHVARAKDATQAIARSLREGTIAGAVSFVAWRALRDVPLEGSQYEVLGGAVAGFVVGMIISVLAAGAAHFRAGRMHDASERMLELASIWLLGVGAIGLVCLRDCTAANDRVVCIAPFFGAIVLGAPALVWDVARRGWIEAVRSGAEPGYRITSRLYGADHHERLVAVRSPLGPEEADGVIEWQPAGLGVPFRSQPPVPVALVSLRRAASLLGDGAVITRLAVFLAAIAACFYAVAQFARSLI